MIQNMNFLKTLSNSFKSKTDTHFRWIMCSQAFGRSWRMLWTCECNFSEKKSAIFYQWSSVHKNSYSKRKRIWHVLGRYIFWILLKRWNFGIWFRPKERRYDKRPIGYFLTQKIQRSTIFTQSKISLLN